MNFVDQFIIDESLNDYTLDKADFPQIALGILIGNLDQIKKVSPNFCNNLLNSEIDVFSKGILLGRVFQILTEISLTLPEKNTQSGSEIINIFTNATELLTSLFSYLGHLQDYIVEIFQDSFTRILHFLAFNDDIVKIALAAYAIKDEIGLVCSLFLFDNTELSCLTNFSCNPEFRYEVIRKGYNFIQSEKIPGNDVLCIVMFIQFQRLVEFGIKDKNWGERCENLHLSFEDCLSEKQKMRLKVIMNRSRQDGHDEGSGRNPRQGGYSDRQSGEKHRNKRYRRDLWPDGVDKETFLRIKRMILVTLEDLRNNYRKNIVVDILIDRLTPAIKINQEVVYLLLEDFSYHEHYYSTKSVVVWTKICDALEEIKEFDRNFYRKIVANVEYIKRNQEIWD